MSDTPQAPLIDDVHDLLAALEFSEVVFYTVSAERDEILEPVSGDQEVSQEFGLRLRHDGSELGARLRLDLGLAFGRVVVDAAAEYVADSPFRVTSEAATDFANKVAVMALLPYIREAVSSLTARVFGQPLTMPIIRAGQLEFEVTGGFENA